MICRCLSEERNAIKTRRFKNYVCYYESNNILRPNELSRDCFRNLLFEIEREITAFIVCQCSLWWSMVKERINRLAKLVRRNLELPNYIYIRNIGPKLNEQEQFIYYLDHYLCSPWFYLILFTCILYKYLNNFVVLNISSDFREKWITALHGNAWNWCNYSI